MTPLTTITIAGAIYLGILLVAMDDSKVERGGFTVKKTREDVKR